MRPSTSYLARAVIAAAAMALVAAGCGSDDGADGSDAGGGGPGIVSLAEVDGTGVLTDAEGHTLYTAEVEKGGKILCVDACVDFWVPIVATDADVEVANSALGDDFATVERPDGKSQLTHDGLPLYTFAEEGAGELKGDGFTDDFQGTQFVWAAARTDGTPSKSSTPDDGGGGYGY